jgi:hypothetical protein
MDLDFKNIKFTIMRYLLFILIIHLGCKTKYIASSDDYNRIYEKFLHERPPDILIEDDDISRNLNNTLFRFGETIRWECDSNFYGNTFDNGYFVFRLRNNYDFIEEANNFAGIISPKIIGTPNDRYDLKYLNFVLVDHLRAILYSPYADYRKYPIGKKDYLDRINIVPSNEKICKKYRQIKGYYKVVRHPKLIIGTDSKCKSKSTFFYADMKIDSTLKPDNLSDDGIIHFVGEYKKGRYVIFTFLTRLISVTDRMPSNKRKEINTLNLKRISILNESNIHSEFSHYEIPNDYSNFNSFVFEFIKSGIILDVNSKSVIRINRFKNDNGESLYTVYYKDGNTVTYSKMDYNKFIGY